MKKTMKSILSAVLCVAVMFGCVAIGFTTAMGSDDLSNQAWSKAYYNFYMSGAYKEKFISYEFPDSSGNDPKGPRLGLWDLNGDGVPELLVADPYQSGTYGHGYFYTYKNGKVEYVGWSDSFGGQWNPHYVKDKSYSGIFTYIWYRGEYTSTNDMVFHRIYCSYDGTSFTSTDVCADYTVPEKYERITDDVSLFNSVSKKDSGTVELTYISDIFGNTGAKLGWNGFLAKYVNADKWIGTVSSGDVTFDNKINSTDALNILQHATGIRTLSGNALKAADVTGDNKVNSEDALVVMQYSTGLIKNL